MDFLDEIGSRILCGDGAMGTLLAERGVPMSQCFEELCISRPELIEQIHLDYLAAGARIIETNSFGANAVRLARHGLENRVNELNWQAAQTAKAAARAAATTVAKGANIYVAGSVGPLGISEANARESHIDREAVFREQIGALLDGGVNLVIFETFTDPDELLLALYVKQSLHHCPAICCLASPESGRLPSGEMLGAAMRRLIDAGADLVGLNCITGPGLARRLMDAVPIDAPLAVYPNAGRPMYHEGRYVYETSAQYFAESAKAIAAGGAGIIGGCCGTTPDHIRALAFMLAEIVPTERVQIVVEKLPDQPETTEPAETSLLDQLAAGHRVILTEFDPPKNLHLDHYLRGAEALVAAGTDFLTLADNSLAILRVSNLALGIRLKQMGLPTLLHLSCRDRNVLGLQSDLMGMAAHGIRHVLPLTGDPAKVGDHPGASSVYDVNSISLIEIIRRMNEGFSQAGTALKRSPGFVIGCTFNPNAKNLEAQVSRLRRKIDAGAQYVMTQPVFDPALIDQTKEATRDLSVPIFVGVWPLLNGRQAVFLHNEVPGISIPAHILAHMEGQEGDAGLAAGMRVAEDISRRILGEFPGIYLMTPFQRYDVTVRLSGFVRSL